MVRKPAESITEPAVISFVDGTTLQTTWQPNDNTHTVVCDYCGSVVNLTKSAHPKRILSHRGSQVCRARQRKRNEMLDDVGSQFASSSRITIDDLMRTVRIQSRDTTPQPSPRPSQPGTPRRRRSPVRMSQIASQQVNRSPSPTPGTSIREPGAKGFRVQLVKDVSMALQNTLACPGIMITWDDGSIWENYAYTVHTLPHIPWIPIAMGSDDHSVRLRANECDFPTTGSNGMTCQKCYLLQDNTKFKNFMDRAVEVKENTPYDYLTPRQMKKLLKRFNMEKQVLRTKLSNAHRRLRTAGQRLADKDRITMMLAQHDFPSLRRLLSVALRRGSSSTAILHLLERSLAGLYSPLGGFSQRDLDVAFLAKAIGGPRLLYALQKSHHLPSDRTVRRNNRIPRLLPSIGIPSRSEIDTNIRSFLDPEVKPPPSKANGNSLPGHILMFDGVALEQRCRYCPKRDSILGLCREHGSNVDLNCRDFTSIDKVRELLEESDSTGKRKLCFGSDATVVAIAPYGQSDHYTPTPLVVSPSDKTEKGEEMKKWIETVLDAWEENEFGENLHGPIWALGSDGDSSFRVAKHLLCMKRMVPSDSELGKLLCELPGLNLQTSVKGVVGTCDPKHVFKRFATLLRNQDGITIFDDVIKPTDIIHHLSLLDGMDRTKAKQLLDPSDKQNVPKAVSLLQHLQKLAHLPPPPNPSEARHRQSLVFLAEFLAMFLMPFISVDMSISEQASPAAIFSVRSLSAFGHVASAMYLKHGTGCLTGALYHDAQAIIKNIIFTIARMQLVDQSLPFYLILEGTDRLEMVFSDCRTQDHSRNFDIEQLASKLSTGTLINATFQRNPDLDSGHRRLSLKDAMGIDHVNPRSWIGNVLVGGVDLKKEWNAGREMGNTLLAKYYGGTGAQLSPDHFALPGRDLLSPNGGPPVGISASVDDKRSEEDNTISSAAPVTDEPIPDESEFDELGLDLDDFLPQTPAELEEGRPTAQACKLVHEGKTYYKSSIVATLCSNRAKKVTMRTLRVRGIALEDLQRRPDDIDIINLDDGNLTKCGDLCGVLARAGESVCIAVMEVTGFRRGSERTILSSCDLHSSESPSTKIQVLGQLLDLSPSYGSSWTWSGKYIDLDTESQDQRLTQRRVALDVPSTVVFPLTPKIVAGNADLGPKITWQIDQAEMESTMTTAWDCLDINGEDGLENYRSLPTVKNPVLPYRNTTEVVNSLTIPHADLPTHHTNPPVNRYTKVKCKLCTAHDKKELPLHKMREHVGRHILCAARDQKDPTKLKREVGVEPCGFCGEDACITRLTTKKDGKNTVTSTCPYFYNMNYVQPISSLPPHCTNTPIHCSICPPSASGKPRTIFKYNAVFHIIAEHANPDDPSKAPIPGDMVVNMFISRDEETKMGIPEEVTREYRSDFDLPQSDDIIEIQSGKRDRAATVTITTAKRRRAGTIIQEHNLQQ